MTLSWHHDIWPIPHHHLQLSAQKALLGRVSSLLRPVFVDVDQERLTVIFYYEGEISDNDFNRYTQVISEVQSDFYVNERNLN